MKTLDGKVAFVTGGASGIGLGLAEALGARGMSVMVADLDEDRLAEAVGHLRGRGVEADGVVCDVARRDSVQAAAARAMERFGKVHVVCNNAGVPVGGPFGRVPQGDWSWVLDVNLLGVVHGMETFVPLIEAHGEGGWIVNTSSMAGLLSPPTMEPYCATKAAVVAMSEGWAAQLASRSIGVSVLCPGVVRSRIDEGYSRRPAAYGPAPAPAQRTPRALSMVQEGIPALAVGERVVEAILAGELHIITHPEYRASVEARFARILAAFDRADASPAISVLPPRTLPYFARVE
ncbi:MAG: SDR family NAD(P)-dependent oxidoreductase [Pseudomonadota bacterium]